MASSFRADAAKKERSPSHFSLTLREEVARPLQQWESHSRMLRTSEASIFFRHAAQHAEWLRQYAVEEGRSTRQKDLASSTQEASSQGKDKRVSEGSFRNADRLLGEMQQLLRNGARNSWRDKSSGEVSSDMPSPSDQDNMLPDYVVRSYRPMELSDAGEPTTTSPLFAIDDNADSPYRVAFLRRSTRGA